MALKFSDEDRWSMVINGILSGLPKSRFIKVLTARTYIQTSVHGFGETNHLIIEFLAKGHTIPVCIRQALSIPLDPLEQRAYYSVNSCLDYICDKIASIITKQAIPLLESLLALEGEPGMERENIDILRRQEKELELRYAIDYYGNKEVAPWPITLHSDENA